MKKGSFKLGRIVTVTFWRDANKAIGHDLIDWPTASEREAREFATETSNCRDVDFVAFHGRRNKNAQIFSGGDKVKLCFLGEMPC